MDHAKFFSAVRSSLFGGSLHQRAVDGLSALLTAFVEYGDGDRQKLAYILATAFHEGDRFRTMEEYASGAAYEGRGDLGNTQAGDGKRFKGRGFVQITGRRNYADWSARLDLDLVANPALAEQTSIAARICVEGMMLGTFTGRKLGQYVHGGDADYREARRVVNGMDKAELIAGYAKAFDAALVAARYGAAEEIQPSPPIVVEIPTTPAKEPTVSDKPNLTPIEQTQKANSGAIGAGVGSGGLGAGIVYLWSLTDWFPAEWKADPQAIIAVTGIMATLFAAPSAWIAAYRASDKRFTPSA